MKYKVLQKVVDVKYKFEPNCTISGGIMSASYFNNVVCEMNTIKDNLRYEEIFTLTLKDEPKTSEFIMYEGKPYSITQTGYDQDGERAIIINKTREVIDEESKKEAEMKKKLYEEMKKESEKISVSCVETPFKIKPRVTFDDIKDELMKNDKFYCWDKIQI